ncbi:hypothetical protein, partial [Saccharothrix sp. Mg75]|uniref:hypothetical protein n=1 Tax=Saccharothrix sp. Mg75 TaxID=3445357 RepID=UPI003EEFE6E9
MEAEVVGQRCVLTLSRDELVMILGLVSTLNNTLPSEVAYQDMVGWSKEEVYAFAHRIAECARAMP